MNKLLRKLLPHNIFAISLDECEFAAHTLMTYIRNCLRFRPNEEPLISNEVDESEFYNTSQKKNNLHQNQEALLDQENAKLRHPSNYGSRNTLDEPSAPELREQQFVIPNLPNKSKSANRALKPVQNSNNSFLHIPRSEPESNLEIERPTTMENNARNLNVKREKYGPQKNFASRFEVTEQDCFENEQEYFDHDNFKSNQKELKNIQFNKYGVAQNEMNLRAPMRVNNYQKYYSHPEINNLNNEKLRPVSNLRNQNQLKPSAALTLITGGTGSPGVSTLTVGLALASAKQSGVSIYEMEEEWPVLPYLTDHNIHSNGGKSEIHSIPNRSALASKIKRKGASYDEATTNILNLSQLDFSNPRYILESIDLRQRNFIDMGRMSAISNLDSDRRKNGIIFNELAHESSAIIYCVKAQNVNLLHLHSFMEELRHNRNNWNMIFILNMLKKGKSDRSIQNEFNEAVSGYPSFILPFDSNIPQVCPLKKPFAGQFGQELEKVEQMIG